MLMSSMIVSNDECYGTYHREAKRKGPRKTPRQVSSDEKYEENLENHNYSNDIVDEIKKITQLFIERKDTVLRSNHNAHELDGPLIGFSSLHLYPSEYGDRDIVILYKIHRDDHVVLHKIGSHEFVYGKSKRK